MSEPTSIENCKACKKSGTCFQHLYPDELEFISNKKKQLTYLKGENIYKQGAFAPFVLYVLEGVVKIYLQTGRERQVNIKLATAGDFLAFSSVFGENVYSHSAMAIKDSVVCMIDKSALSKLLLKNPEFGMSITSANCRNEGHLLEIIRNISYKQMQGKVASAVSYLSADEFMNEDVFNYLTRQDIADFAAVSPESAIKFLKDFEKDGILRLDGKNITVLDRNRLEDISRRG